MAAKNVRKFVGNGQTEGQGKKWWDSSNDHLKLFVKGIPTNFTYLYLRQIMTDSWGEKGQIQHVYHNQEAGTAIVGFSTVQDRNKLLNKPAKHRLGNAILEIVPFVTRGAEAAAVSNGGANGNAASAVVNAVPKQPTGRIIPSAMSQISNGKPPGFQRPSPVPSPQPLTSPAFTFDEASAPIENRIDQQFSLLMKFCRENFPGGDTTTFPKLSTDIIYAPGQSSAVNLIEDFARNVMKPAVPEMKIRLIVATFKVLYFSLSKGKPEGAAGNGNNNPPGFSNTEREKMDKTVENHSNDLKDIKKELAEIKKENQSLKTENTDLKSQLQNICSKLERLEVFEVGFQDYKEALEAKLSKMEFGCNSLSKTMEKNTNDNLTLIENIVKMNEVLNSQREEIVVLRESSVSPDQGNSSSQWSDKSGGGQEFLQKHVVKICSPNGQVYEFETDSAGNLYATDIESMMGPVNALTCLANPGGSVRVINKGPNGSFPKPLTGWGTKVYSTHQTNTNQGNEGLNLNNMMQNPPPAYNLPRPIWP